MSQLAALMEQSGPYLVGPGFPEEAARRVAGEAVERYNEPWRFHHAFDHLADVTGYLVEVAEDLRSPRASLWTGIGHDAVMIPQLLGGVNEDLSAQWTVAKLEPYLSGRELELIDRYVRASASHSWDRKDSDLAHFLDADLKILGAPPEAFEAYDANIRREYSFVDLETYRQGRYAILNGFYRQKRLFITDTAHERFEDQAKANLERKLGELAGRPTGQA